MKYFIDLKERIAYGQKSYIEFRAPYRKGKLCDNDSLFMSLDVMKKSGFYDFWKECAYNDIVFDMDTISNDEMLWMVKAAENYGDTVFEVMEELKLWAEVHFRESENPIIIVWEYDRILEKTYDQKNIAYYRT